MTKEEIRQDALRIGEEEAAKVTSALRVCGTPQQVDKIVANLQGSVDRIFKERHALSGDTIDCKARCSFCCHMKVDVFPWDIFPIVEFMKKNFTKEQIEEVHAKAKARKEKTQHLTYEQHEEMRLPCPLLRDGKCSVYEARPLSCRKHHSHRVSLCESGFNNPTKIGRMEEVQEIRTVLAVVVGWSAEAFGEAGYDNTWYDLSAALDEALSNPKAQKRWRDGKKPFSKDAVVKSPAEKPRRKEISVSDVISGKQSPDLWDNQVDGMFPQHSDEEKG